MKTLQITDELRRACMAMLNPDADDADVRAVVGAFAYAVLNQHEESQPQPDPAKGAGLPELDPVTWFEPKVYGEEGATWGDAREADTCDHEGFWDKTGTYYYLENEGKSWRRVQQAEPAVEPPTSAEDAEWMNAPMGPPKPTPQPCSMCAGTKEVDAKTVVRYGMSSTFPAGSVTTESEAKIACPKCQPSAITTEHLESAGYRDGSFILAMAREDIIANIDRATRELRLSVAGLSQELEDIARVLDPQGVRKDVTTAWLVEHGVKALRQQHTADQERIRELEARVDRLNSTIDECAKDDARRCARNATLQCDLNDARAEFARVKGERDEARELFAKQTNETKRLIAEQTRLTDALNEFCSALDELSGCPASDEQASIVRMHRCASKLRELDDHPTETDNGGAK